MSYHTKIIFGKDQVRKYHNNEEFSGFEKSINFKKYIFETKAERNAFYKGVAESMGRLEFEVINEFEDKSTKKRKMKVNLTIGDSSKNTIQNTIKSAVKA